MAFEASTELTSEQLQDLLLESPSFSEFLLGLTTISAARLGGTNPMLCAITVERDGSPATVASSDEEARRLDEKQYAFDNGPCLTALRGGRVVHIRDVAADNRWEHYSSALSGEGIHSVLAVPIDAGPGAAAALNCYALSTNAFEPDTIAKVQDLAESISRILRLALRVHAPETYPEHLRSALQSRAVIDAALSLIMVQNRCSRDQAMELLHQAALASDARLHSIAKDILQGATLPTATPFQ